MSIFTRLFLFAAIGLAIFPACNSNSNSMPVATDSIPEPSPAEMGIPGSFSAQTKLTFDSLLIQSFLDSFPLFDKFGTDIRGFYRGRNYAYAWFDEKGMIEHANNLFNRIQLISEEGLPDSIPYKSAFVNLMELESGSGKIMPPVELMLTAQYLAYAKKVWVGISEKESLSTEWLLPRKKISSKALLDSLVAGDNNLLDNSPMFIQYDLLKTYLKKYHQLQASGRLATNLPGKKSYRLKDSSSAVADIRERLFLLGDLAENNASSLYDSMLEEGVKNVEKRLGFKQDGIADADLLKELNYPVEKRIEEILVNMERSRWVPNELQSDFLLVNIPEFKLHVYEADSLAFSMNVVVGKEQHKTVVFNGDMKYIVFSPYWNIPPGIMKNETLPAVRRNRNYLARHNMEWHNGSIRQKPGPNNSLGLVKFLFPNSHNIYLHDTPAKSLFNESTRAFSHGCIRVAEPTRLADYLLRNDTSWTQEKIVAAMNKGVEKYVTLKKPVPVFIAYFTAWVDKSGKLNFRKDIYDRNGRLAKMIFEKPAI